MSTAYAPEEWKDLFVAMAGASAALAGLLFVAVSINVERIVKYEGLPERGIETLALLLAAAGRLDRGPDAGPEPRRLRPRAAGDRRWR